MAEVELWIDVSGGEYSLDSEYKIQDSSGRWPSYFTKFEHRVFFHPKTGHLYAVVGVIFQSELDRWMIAYQRVTRGGLKTGPVFCHLPEDFEREGRFMEVKK